MGHAQKNRPGTSWIRPFLAEVKTRASESFD